MKQYKYFSVCLSRLKFTMLSFENTLFLFFFCIYIISTIFTFLSYGSTEILALEACMLYIWTQPSSYYLLYVPSLVFLLVHCIDLGEYEFFRFSRYASGREYNYERIFAIIVLVVFSIMAMTSLAWLPYSIITNPSIEWGYSCEYLKQFGINLVSDSMNLVPSYVVVLLQLVLIIFSFIALGLFMLLTQNITKNKFVTVICSLCLDCVLYLGLKSDLPLWLNNILPYKYLFLPYFDSFNHIFSALFYWLSIIYILCVTILWFSKYNDMMEIYHETECY